jgi:hypothetical protein
VVVVVVVEAVLVANLKLIYTKSDFYKIFSLAKFSASETPRAIQTLHFEVFMTVQNFGA